MSPHFPSRATRPRRALVFPPELSLSSGITVSTASHDMCATRGLSVEAAGSRATHRAIAGGRGAVIVGLTALSRRLGARRTDDSSSETDDADAAALAGYSVAADGEASAKLGPAHTFSLSLGALERTESRHTPLLFTTSVSDREASLLLLGKTFCLFRFNHPRPVEKMKLNHLCILNRVLCWVQVRHDCCPHGNTTM